MKSPKFAVSSALLAVVLLTALRASAQDEAGARASVNPDVRGTTGYQWVAADQLQSTPVRTVVGPSFATPAELSSRLVFLNNCINTPCDLHFGANDSRTNASPIIGVPAATLSQFPYSDQTWQAFMQCARDTLAPFNVTVTDVDPGNVPHWENMVAGHPNDVGMGSGIAGVSPWSGGCVILDNTITFTFAKNHSDNPEALCWTAVQEVAHSWGLDHELLQKSPMTYLSGNLPKRFLNIDAQCGEQNPRLCSCAGDTQNSVKYLMEIFGPGVAIPPTVRLMQPPNLARVTPGFVVKSLIKEDLEMEKTELLIDGVVVAQSTEPPYFLTAPDNVTPGEHKLVVLAHDTQGASGESREITVTVGDACSNADDCGAGDNLCHDGVCIPGPKITGGLGSVCASDSECFDNFCASNDNQKKCAMRCTDGESCPNGFSCEAIADGTQACWKSSGGGGCESGGRELPLVAIAFGLLCAWLTTRRRARKV